MRKNMYKNLKNECEEGHYFILLKCRRRKYLIWHLYIFYNKFALMIKCQGHLKSKQVINKSK